MSSNYWSSTTNANNTDNAWNVNFNNGNVNNNNKSDTYYVRAVRAGKCSLLSFESVYKAYLDCRRRKRGTINALRFEYDLLNNLFILALDLQRGSYQPSRSVCFVTTRPKLREIFAADFRDRVVHHLIVRQLERIWEPKFIYDSYASRHMKGTHAAVERLQGFMTKATRNQKIPAYFLQLDIRSFFMSIDKDILFKILEANLFLRKDIESDVLLYLLCRTIFHNCVEGHLFKGDPAMIKRIPPHKSLFHMPPNKGLPIGNLTSQFFANVYLNELDQFVKHVLRCPFYVRYVDDFILVSQKKEQLQEWEKRIEEFLETRLDLHIKEKGRIKSVNDGCDFLGYIVRPGYMLSRNRVVNNLKHKLALFHDRMIRPLKFNGMGMKRISMDPCVVTDMRQVLASYLGHFKHANTFNLVQSLFETHSWLKEFFVFHKGKLKDRFRHNGVFRSFYAQYAFFRAKMLDTVLFFKVGRFMELYNHDAVAMAKTLELKVIRDHRGMRYSAGFPVLMERRCMRRALCMGKDLAVVDEGIHGPFVKERYVKEIYRFTEN